MFQPENEQGLIVAFAMRAASFGWEVVQIGTAYPDAILRYQRPGGGTEDWVTEFEYKSSNFLLHKHDPRGCELIVCWENDWTDCPLPVLEVRRNDWGFVSKVDPVQVEIAYWKQRAMRAERQLKTAVNDVPDMWELFPVGGRPKADDRVVIDAALALVEQGVPTESLTINFFRRRLGPLHNGGEQLGKERADRIRRAVFDTLGLLDESLEESQ